MRLQRLLLPVALFLVAGAAQAAPQRYPGDDGATTSPSGTDGATRDGDAADDASGRRGARPDRATPARAPARPAAPRWHSFLPGMFR